MSRKTNLSKLNIEIIDVEDERFLTLILFIRL